MFYNLEELFMNLMTIVGTIIGIVLVIFIIKIIINFINKKGFENAYGIILNGLILIKMGLETR